MIKTRVIPCLDVKDGRVVKGVNFVNLIDAGDPVESARAYDAAGADELCFLDITATQEGRSAFLSVIERVAAVCFMPLTVGGGVKSIEDLRDLMLAGADKVSINSAAVRDPSLISRAAEKVGSQAVVVAIDAKRVSAPSEPPRYEIFTHGGYRSTGLEAVSFAKQVADLGAGEILLTSMDADGTKAGYNLELNRLISEAVPIPVVASGGAGTLQHFVDAVTEGKADAVLAASVFHFGQFSIGEVKQAMLDAAIAIRPTP